MNPKYNNNSNTIFIKNNLLLLWLWIRGKDIYRIFCKVTKLCLFTLLTWKSTQRFTVHTGFEGLYPHTCGKDDCMISWKFVNSTVVDTGGTTVDIQTSHHHNRSPVLIAFQQCRCISTFHNVLFTVLLPR